MSHPQVFLADKTDHPTMSPLGQDPAVGPTAGHQRDFSILLGPQRLAGPGKWLHSEGPCLDGHVFGAADYFGGSFRVLRRCSFVP